MKALCRVAACAAFCLSLAILARQADSETISHMMARSCPAAWAADVLAQREAAVDDRREYESFLQASGLYYDCAYRLRYPSYERDWAIYQYASRLMSSGETPEESVRRTWIAQMAANELAASTRFVDVRKKALVLREDAKRQYRLAYKSLYGNFPDATPEPMPTPEPMETD